MQPAAHTRVFYHLLGNTLIASVTNIFVWFALTFWVFIETQSVLATSWIAGAFAVANMVSALFFGGVVDHHTKRGAMLFSSFVSLVAYLAGGALFLATPYERFTDATSPELWLLIVILMCGSVAGNLRTIALTTTVTLLFTAGRDKANGMVGAMNGIGFSITSALSGLAIGFFGMKEALICAIVATALAAVHLLFILIPGDTRAAASEEGTHRRLDIRGTIALIGLIPGLFVLIFFTTFNNFLGGVFMALMDPYGLSLVSVEVWGTMFAVASLGFIAGSAYIAKRGLGARPLRLLLLANVVAWTTCIFFTIQPSFILLAIGMIIWLTLVPFMEAAEHTVIQAVVPYERQGRVFGFAQSVESAATPITTLLIGPIAHFVFIPFMTTGAGVALIGGWFGVGLDRGIALVFMLAGALGLVVTLLAFKTRAYHLLSDRYAEAAADQIRHPKDHTLLPTTE